MKDLPKRKEELHASYDITNISALRHISKSVERSIRDVNTGMQGRRSIFPTKWDRLNRNLMGGLQPLTF